MLKPTSQAFIVARKEITPNTAAGNSEAPNPMTRKPVAAIATLTIGPAPPPTYETSCNDEVDNDGDGFINEDDARALFPN